MVINTACPVPSLCVIKSMRGLSHPIQHPTMTDVPGMLEYVENIFVF